MEEIDIDMIKEIRHLIETSRSKVRTLIDSHMKEIPHDPERRELEMKFFFKALRVITKKWTVQILWELEVNDGLIFNEIGRHLEGISSRSLSNALKILEKYKLISRNVQDTRPPSVLYKLNHKGKALVELSMMMIILLLDL